MERELWLRIYRLLAAIASPRGKRVQFSDRLVLAVYFWSVLHDRSVSWAVNPRNWHRELLSFSLPSQSTLSRRLRGPGVQYLLDALRQAVNKSDPNDTLVKIIDSKPLPVGGYSVAKDARWGHAIRGLARGYKLHALYGRGLMPIAWEVVPMNASEQRVAKRLLRQLRGGGYVLADSVYDINRLYDQAALMNHQLIAKRKRPDAGLGHRPQSRHRLRAIELLSHPFGRTLYARRSDIERRFARLTNFGGGLAPLPNWVRKLPRVRRWVAAKLLIDALRRAERQRLTA